MNYGLSKDKIQKTTSPNFPVAVDNICNMEKCEYTTKSKGDQVWEGIEFTYVMSTKDVDYRQTDMRFAVVEDTVKVKDGETHEDAVERAVTAYNTMLHHIATKFNCTDAEMDNIGGRTFEEMANNFCKLIMSKIKSNNPDLFLKTFNSNGYSKVSPFVPFLQRVDEGPCKLTWTKNEKKENALSHSNGAVEAKETENYV